MSILQYLNGTKNKSIHYNKNNKFIGYLDSDFANDEKTRNLQVDIYFYLEKALFHGNLSYRKTLTLSTAEAEFVSLTECTKQALWFKN